MSLLLRRALVLSLMLAAVSITQGASSPPAQAGTSAGVDRVERDIVRRLNAYRHARGLGQVEIDRRMTIGANSHSGAMARYGYFSHGSNWDRRTRRYSRSNSVGEIIGYTRRVSPHHQPRVMVSTWVNSGPHRAVILKRGFTRVGIGRVRRGDTEYFTVDFAGR